MSDLFDLWHDARLDSTEQLGYTIAANNLKAELIVEDGMVEWNNRRFYVAETETIRNGTETTIEVRCNALWYRLGQIKRPGTFLLEQQTVKDGLDTILENTGWVSTGSTAATGSISLEVDDGTVLSLVRSWAEVCDGFVVFDTWLKTVDVVSARGREALGSAFRYARNLTSINRRVRPPSVTRLYAYGADSLNFAGINGGKEYVEDYTYYTDQGISLATARELYTKSELVSDTSIVADADLLVWARSKLADLSQPEVTYECKVVDLQDMDPKANEYRLEIGDQARVTDDPLGIDVLTTVVRLKRYPLAPWRNEVELAYLYSPAQTGASNSRGSSTDAWLMFKSDSVAQRPRFDATVLLNRIGLRFREGGEAIFGYDITFTGVGTGTASASALDSVTGDLLHSIASMSYTDGEIVQQNMTWAQKDMFGPYDVRMRFKAVSSGGPSVAEGAEIDTSESRLWILAKGAVRETPTAPNTIRFDGYSETDWTVPDGVYEITAECVGGAQDTTVVGGTGRGGMVTVKIPVTPNEVLHVVAGGAGTNGAASSGGGPNGGSGGRAGSFGGFGGGGSSHIIRSGGSFTDAIVVAAGAGGGGDFNITTKKGGDGGLFFGEDGMGVGIGPGLGANQFAGGAGGSPDGEAGDTDGVGFGGDGNSSGNAFHFGGGGGGGGWHGGGGARTPASTAGGGGGGSGWVSDAAVLDSYADGSHDEEGYVELTWETPDLG